MYAIQNMKLRSNHAPSGSLRENKRRLCALEVVLAKKHVHSQSGRRDTPLSTVVACYIIACSCMLTYEIHMYCCFKMRKCKILDWVGQQFVYVYKGVGCVNVNQSQQGGSVEPR